MIDANEELLAYERQLTSRFEGVIAAAAAEDLGADPPELHPRLIAAAVAASLAALRPPPGAPALEPTTILWRRSTTRSPSCAAAWPRWEPARGAAGASARLGVRAAVPEPALIEPVSASRNRVATGDVRVVVTGATGNVGTSVLAALGRDPTVREVVGVARRAPRTAMDKTTWVAADVCDADLSALFAGADAVVHLAWLIQPSRDQATIARANVEGSARVFRAVASAGVPVLAYASSVGAYSPGPKDRRVDERWPTDGIDSSYYSRQKAEVERLLDRFELEAPECRVVRLRPGLIFKQEAATEIRRYFAGPLLPTALLRHGLVPVVPGTERLIFQAVHSRDVGEAFRLALNRGIRARALQPGRRSGPGLRAPGRRPGRTIGEGAGPAAARRRPGHLEGPAATHLARLAGHGAPGAADGPRARAQRDLGWTPRRSSEQALLELLDGMGHGAELPHAAAVARLLRAVAGPRASFGRGRSQLVTRAGPGEGGLPAARTGAEGTIDG